MVIKKAFIKDGYINISYTDDEATVYTMKSSERARQSLYDSAKALKGILVRNLGIPDPDRVLEEDWGSEAPGESASEWLQKERAAFMGRFCSIGVSHSVSNERGDVFRIIGLFGTRHDTLQVQTSEMCAPTPGFWDGHSPWDATDSLTPEDIAALMAFIDAVTGFLNGEREQGDLFCEDEPKYRVTAQIEGPRPQGDSEDQRSLSYDFDVFEDEEDF